MPFTGIERLVRILLLLPGLAVLLTACEVVHEERFTGQITASGITYTMKSAKAPEGGMTNDPIRSEWSYYPERVNRILIVRSPRLQDYSGFQILSPSNTFGVFVMRANPQPKEGHTNETTLHGSLVFKNAEGTAFEVNAQALNQREGVNGSVFVKKHLEVHPTFPFAVLLQMFGIGGSRTVHHAPVNAPDQGTNACSSGRCPVTR
jgi:hypothetical protein